MSDVKAHSEWVDEMLLDNGLEPASGGGVREHEARAARVMEEATPGLVMGAEQHEESYAAAVDLNPNEMVNRLVERLADGGDTLTSLQISSAAYACLMAAHTLLEFGNNDVEDFASRIRTTRDEMIAAAESVSHTRLNHILMERDRASGDEPK